MPENDMWIYLFNSGLLWKNAFGNQWVESGILEKIRKSFRKNSKFI